MRPFFLDAVTQQPLPSKKYYDVVSWLVTQLTFSFVVAPFIVLRLDQSLAVWTSVRFYAIIGTAATMVFFASPGKAYLRSQLETRNKAAGGGLHRSPSTDSLPGGQRPEPVLGISNDPGRDIDEAVQEFRTEIERVRSHKLQGAGGAKAGLGKKEL